MALTRMAHSSSRGPGRPPKSGEAREATRRLILNATRAVFSQVGFHGLSVELVLAQAKLSRPTFYKYFRSVEEPIDLVLAEVNQQLIEAMLVAAQQADTPQAKLEAALVAWRDWGIELGSLLRPLFAELHDATSPASRHRLQTLAILANALGLLMESQGYARPSRMRIDALLNGVEYLGYRFHLETDGGPDDWIETRDVMLDMAAALLQVPEN
jgi:AcrR family transcriptional regulator